MASVRRPEQRTTIAKPYRLGQPLFVHIKRDLASLVAGCCALFAIGASHLYFREIVFGPIFLLICALSAWFVGARFAVMLLLYISGMEYFAGHLSYRHDEGIFSYVDLIIRLGSAFAIILMLGVAREALEIEWRYARIDPLTGALTRKAFFETIEADKSEHGPTVLVFADINGLKQVNDQIGHKAGDEALRTFAEQVTRVIRKNDLFARIGGDEFVIACKVRDRWAAHVIAQRLDNAVNVEQAEGSAHLTCSFGILALPDGLRTIDDELKLADKLMYFAKKQKAGAVVGVSVNGEIHKLRPIASVSEGDDDYKISVWSTDSTRQAADRISKLTEVA